MVNNTSGTILSNLDNTNSLDVEKLNNSNTETNKSLENKQPKDEDNNFTKTTSIKKAKSDTIFGTYFSNVNDGEEIVVNQDGVFLNHDSLNEIVDAQLENSETAYNSIHIQFVLFFIATLILVGFVFIINASGNLSIFVVIILVILLFLIFKFLRFNIINFISNFTL